MNNNDYISSIGEITLIRIIEELIFEKTGRKLIRDDSFFFKIIEENNLKDIILNSDMFNAATDAPEQMVLLSDGTKICSYEYK
ncbi:hypothetical protein ES708_03372 [subsurface metagenome]